MDVASHRERIRSVSPMGAAASAPSSMNVDIENIQVPTSVGLNAKIPFSFEVHANQIPGALDPDSCLLANPLSITGIRATGVVKLGQATSSVDTFCIPLDGRQPYSGEMFSPSSPGTYTMTLEVRGANSGNVFDSVDVPIEVSGQAPPPGDCPDGFLKDPDTGECVPTGGGNGGGGDDGGGAILPCFIDPNRSCASPEMFAWVAIVIIVLALGVLS